MNSEILYSVKAQRGSTLRCKGWKQEGLLRMLENNMENAESPERLVIYGGIGKCARNWQSYHAIVDSLKSLENDETLVVQSGMPVAVFKTHRLAPRVLMANTNIMKATWETFYDLQDKNLTMFAQYTAGPWSGGRSTLRRFAGREDLLHRGPGRNGKKPASRHDHARRDMRRGRRQ
jgi:urocanate hydratase